jgi:hypothetical protein
MEPWIANPNLYTLRQTCENLFVRKIKGSKSHNPLYPGHDKDCYCKWPKHFDLDLVTINYCTNDYQFNDCIYAPKDLDDPEAFE